VKFKNKIAHMFQQHYAHPIGLKTHTHTHIYMEEEEEDEWQQQFIQMFM
jgi:hypothetical protein